MSVRLRLSRQGRKGRPFYYIVAADSRSRRDGRYLEKLGTYNPIPDPAQIDVNHDAALKWLLDGAQPSDTVRSILRYAGINLKFALIKQGKTEEEVETIYQRWVAEKEAKITGKKSRLQEEAAQKAEEAKAQEAKVREAKAAAIAAKNAPPKEEVVEAAPEAEEEAPEAEAAAPEAEATEETSAE